MRLRKTKSGFKKFLALALSFALFCIFIANGCGRKGNLIPPEDEKKKEGKGYIDFMPMVD